MEGSSPQSASPYFDDGVKLISYCPLCEASYNPQEAKVLGEKDDSHLLFIRCLKCENAVISLVLISAVGVSCVGLITDLQFAEVNRFRAAPDVSTDDVIAIHHALMAEDAFFTAIRATL